MDYRSADTIDTDYGQLVVTDRSPTLFGYTRLTLHHEGWDDYYSLGIDETGQPHPESEAAVIAKMRRTYEEFGPFSRSTAREDE